MVDLKPRYSQQEKEQRQMLQKLLDGSENQKRMNF